MSARADRDKKALEDRQSRIGKTQQEFREAELERHRKVEERKELDQMLLNARVQQMAEKAAAPGSSPRHEPPRVEAHNSRQERGRSSEVGGATAKETEESPQVDERKARHGSPLPTFYSKELIDLNNQAHKEYLLRRKELHNARDNMNINKRYKTLAEGAAGQNEGYRSERLKAVQQSQIEKAKKEPSSPISRAVAKPARATPRNHACGLCEKEFPFDHLVGSVLRRNIERMRAERKGRLASGTRKSGHHTDFADEGAEQAASPKQAASPASKSTSLYDYEVKLCVNCDISVRMASS